MHRPTQMTQIELLLAQLSAQVLCAAIDKVPAERIEKVDLSALAKRSRAAVETLVEQSRVAVPRTVQAPGMPS